MEREALRQVFRHQLENDTGEQYPNLDDSRRLREDLGLDSVDVVSLVVYFQSDFGILLKSQDLEKIVNVGELLDLLTARIAAAKNSAA
jgi:acyl carrier protein